MAGSVNKVIIDRYVCGESIVDLFRDTGVPKSTIRFALKRAGVLRSRKEAHALAGAQGKMSRPRRREPLSEAARRNMSIAAHRRWVGRAKGVSIKPNGYVEHTTGPNKGRSVHVTEFEQRIGRRLLPDEVVHHIDGDRSNNDINNLALMTRSAHTRLHRREDALSGNNPERKSNGQFR